MDGTDNSKKKLLDSISCPRATMEISQSHELLQTLRLAFKEDGDSVPEEDPVKEDPVIEDPPKVELAPIEDIEPIEVSGNFGRLIDEAQLDEEISVDTVQPVPLDESAPSPLFTKTDEESEKISPVLHKEVIKNVVQSKIEHEGDLSFWEKCEKLVNSSSWEELSTFAYDAEEADPLQSKFWWIYSQVRQKTLSYTLLVSPLRELLLKINAAQHEMMLEPQMFKQVKKLTKRVFKGLLNKEESVIESFALISAFEECLSEGGRCVKEREAIFQYLLDKEEYLHTPAEKELFALFQQREDAPDRRVEKDEKRSEFFTGFFQSLISRVAHPHALGGVAIALVVLSFGFLMRMDLSLFGGSSDGYQQLQTAFPLSQQPLLLAKHEALETGVLKGLLLDAEDPESFSHRISSLREQRIEKKDDAKVLQAKGVTKKVALDLTGPIEPVGLRDFIVPEDGAIRPRIIGKDFVKGVGRDMQQETPAARTSVRPIPVQVYEVIVDTAVLREPHFEAQVLERVKRGGKIRVIEQIGNWLRLASGNGQYGYILSQDAVLRSSTRS